MSDSASDCTPCISFIELGNKIRNIIAKDKGREVSDIRLTTELKGDLLKYDETSLRNLSVRIAQDRDGFFKDVSAPKLSRKDFPPLKTVIQVVTLVWGKIEEGKRCEP